VKTTAAVTAIRPEMDEPIRAEIFGVERLEQHAESLAAAQRTLMSLDLDRILPPAERERK